MAIEMVRYGEKLRVREGNRSGYPQPVGPSMLLQPIIENSIRHGLSSKVEGGMIRVRSWLSDGRLHRGGGKTMVGIPETKLATLSIWESA